MNTINEQPSGGATLAQQEPVAWMTKDGEIFKHECWPEYEARPLVFGDTSPPYEAAPLAQVAEPRKRTWVGLTANEVEEIFQKKLGYYPTIYAVEAKLKEKNT